VLRLSGVIAIVMVEMTAGIVETTVTAIETTVIKMLAGRAIATE